MSNEPTPPAASDGAEALADASDMDLYLEANEVALEEWTQAQGRMPKDVANLADKQSYLIAFKWGLWRGLMRAKGRIAAHVKAAVSEAVKGLEDELSAVIDTLDGNMEPIKWREGGTECMRKLAEHLEAYQSNIEQLDKAESSRDELAALVVKMREALWAHAENPNDPAAKALALVPADLRDCVVVPRGEWKKLSKGGDVTMSEIKRPDLTAAPKSTSPEGAVPISLVKPDGMARESQGEVDDLRTANGALESENRKMREALERSAAQRDPPQDEGDGVNL